MEYKHSYHEIRIIENEGGRYVKFGTFGWYKMTEPEYSSEITLRKAKISEDLEFEEILKDILDPKHRESVDINEVTHLT